MSSSTVWDSSMDYLHQGHETTRRPSSGHEAALRTVQKPPSKSWRAGGLTTAPTPPSVYRVEPREFRDLVQRLTGAPAAARQQHHPKQQQLVPRTQPVAALAGDEDVAGAQLYAAAVPWCSVRSWPRRPCTPDSTATA